MPRIVLALAVGGLMLVSVAHSAERARYSGTVTAISPNGQTITLRELGAGSASGGNLVINRSIALKPDTSMKLAARVEAGEAADWPGGFKEVSIAAGDLRVGDFATVEAESHDRRLQAVSVVVVRP